MWESRPEYAIDNDELEAEDAAGMLDEDEMLR